MGLPQARIVRQGGQVFAAPPPPPPVRSRRPGQLREQMHDGLALAIGLWPLVLVMLMIIAFFVMGIYSNQP